MKKIILLIVLAFSFLGTQQAFSQEPYIGEIKIFAGNFAPRGWALCEGQLLPIAQNTALFAVIGTTYGGNGQTTFALPDLRGRLVLHAGQGSGLTTKTLGEKSGTESNTLTVNQMPAHSHSILAVSTNGNQSTPVGNLPANTGTLDKEYSNATANTQMKSTMLNNSGGNMPFNNIQPYNTVNYVIAVEGIYPSQGGTAKQ